MSTYVLGSLGTAIGGPIGGMIGAALGSMIDRQLMLALTPNTTTRTNSVGPRVTELSLTNSLEGAVVPRVVGRARLGGQVIWATQFKEVAETTTQTQTAGGKGGGGGQTAETTTTVYKYYLSFAVAFCEGNKRAQLGRVWIDSNETDLSQFNIRWYSGSETQSPDPLIQAKDGADNAPAFRGISYLVFEDMPLEKYGNRLPQITAEVVVPLDAPEPDDIQTLGKAFHLIPATGEAVYATQVYRDVQNGGSKTQNLHNNFRVPDAVLAVDQLMQFQEGLEAVALVVSWFGTDLRAGECRIIPKIEDRSRSLQPSEWAVAGYTRATAELVSRDTLNRPIFGGTPSDAVVLEMVDYLISKGKRVVFYPFILMDVPTGNTLPNPYSNNAATAGQPVFPWRGRITCSPAAGYTGTVDKTATAGTQIDTFFTRTEGYRAMVLHYANLLSSKAIDTFIIGSELVGVTQTRSSASAYPGVSQLVTLAADVSAILGGSKKVGYAADWSEYHSHRPADGSNDVYFNLDPLWASADIDFIGIDNYLPVSDWRTSFGHLDYDPDGPVSEYDPNYIKDNIEGGEYFDWYYASSSDREAQVRTPITDGAYGKHWVFRQKDMRSWWLNAHKNRPGGVESVSATSWTAQSKPIWFTEFGCPAVYLGTNQPNVFYDPKSSESFYPYFSNGKRDDSIQRMYLECMLQYWRDNAPTSGVYGDKMVKPANMFIWTWDARPFPAYPSQLEVWSDGDLWLKGHWMSGRIDGAVLPRLVASICRRAGLSDAQIDVAGLYGPDCVVRGMVIGGASSERDILESLGQFYMFNGFESEGKLKFVMSLNAKTLSVDSGDLVLADGATFPVSLTRQQETELPKAVKLTFIDEMNGFQAASVDGQKSVGNAQNVVQLSFPMVSSADRVRSLGLLMIQQAWRAREHGSAVLPPSYASVEQGDCLLLPANGRTLSVRVDKLDMTRSAAIEFSGFETSILSPSFIKSELRLPTAQPVYQSAQVLFMDLPLFTDMEELPHAPRLAAYASPWPGGINLLKSDGVGGYVPIQTLSGKAHMGVTTSALASGPVDRWDRVNTVDVSLYEGELSSVTEAQLLNGVYNAVAILNGSTGLWEVLQFTTATLLSAKNYRLSGLLRGQLDTGDAMVGGPYAVGSSLVVLEPALVRALNVSKAQALVATEYLWGPKTYPSTDPTYVSGTKTGALRGLRPYTPCDASVSRDSGTGVLTISWKRRTRLNGDSWDQLEVPLTEEAELYELSILASLGGAVKRTTATSSPSWSYSLADQTTDFGGAQSVVCVRIRQYGQEYGAYGGTLEVQLPIRSST